MPGEAFQSGPTGGRAGGLGLGQAGGCFGIEGSKVLVVEDEGIVALDIEAQVRELGYLVVGMASSGPEAVEKVRHLEPDLVLMDVRLEGEMDGVAAAEVIHRSRDVPIIFVTAFVDDDTVRRIVADAPSGYLLKPFDERELCVAMHAALQHRLQTERMRDRERRLTAILESAPAALLVANTEGRLEYMNPRAEELTGWLEEDAIGLEVDQVLGIRGFQPAEATSERVCRLFPLVARNGRVRRVDVETAPLGAASSAAGVIWLLRAADRCDVTAQRDQRMRGDVLATVSRDLRTSLASVAAATELLLRSAETCKPPKPVEQRARSIRRCATRMSRLIDELTGANAGLARLNPPERCSVGDLVKEAHELFEPLAAEGGRGFVTQPPRPDVEVVCDRERVALVLSSLLENAIQRTDEGDMITLAAEATRDEVRFTVSDTGPGLASVELARVLERQWQAPATVRPSAALDTFTAKDVIAAHGGRIEGRAEPGKGSSVSFTLPRAAG